MKKLFAVLILLLMPIMALAYDDEDDYWKPPVNHAEVYSGNWINSDSDYESGYSIMGVHFDAVIQEERLVMDVRPDGTGYQLQYSHYRSGEDHATRITSAPFRWSPEGDSILVEGEGGFGARFSFKEYHGSTLYSYGNTSMKRGSLPREIVERLSGRWYLTAVKNGDAAATPAAYAQILDIGKDYTYAFQGDQLNFSGAYMVWDGEVECDFYTGWVTTLQLSEDMSTISYKQEDVTYIYTRDGANVADLQQTSELAGSYWSGTYYDGFDNEIRMGVSFQHNGRVLLLRQAIGEHEYGVIERIEGTYTGDAREATLDLRGTLDFTGGTYRFERVNGLVYLFDGCMMVREDLSRLMPQLQGQWIMQSCQPSGYAEPVTRDGFEAYNQTAGYRALYDTTYELTNDFFIRRYYEDENGQQQVFEGKFIIYNGEAFFNTTPLTVSEDGQTLTESSSWGEVRNYTRQTEMVPLPAVEYAKQTYDTSAVYTEAFFAEQAAIEAAKTPVPTAVPTPEPTPEPTATPAPTATPSPTPVPSIEDYEYEVLEDGTICIVKYTGDDAEVVIPAQINGQMVTAIATNAFTDNTTATSIIIPEGVNRIDSYAFSYCENLLSVNVPQSVTEMGSSVFTYCRKLQTVDIASKMIGDSMFWACGELRTVNHSGQITSIGNHAFLGCYNLTSFTLPDCVEKIGSGAFEGTVVAEVQEGSYAEAYCFENGVPYVYHGQVYTGPAPTYTSAGLSRFAVRDNDIPLGRYEQDNDLSNGPEQLKWTVLEKRNGMVLVSLWQGLDVMPYHHTDEEVTWETSSLRAWLNGEFLNSTFTPEEQEIILSTVISNPDNPITQVDGGNDTQDRIFLLSMDEMEYYYQDYDDRQLRPTDYAAARGAVSKSVARNWTDRQTVMLDNITEYWTRSPGRSHFSAAHVGIRGYISSDGRDVTDENVCFIPAMWLKVDEPIVEEDPFCQEGSQILLGRYELDGDAGNGTEPLNWRVLHREDGKALLITEQAIAHRAYNGEHSKYVDSHNQCGWDESTIRQWLNGEFFTAVFSDAEKAAVLESELWNSDNAMYHTDAGESETLDRVFLLSYGEATSYFRGTTARQAKAAPCIADISTSKYPGNVRWFLRSPGSLRSEAMVVLVSGVIDDGGVDLKSMNVAIRPAIWADVEALRTVASLPQETQAPAPETVQATEAPTSAPVQTEAPEATQTPVIATEIVPEATATAAPTAEATQAPTPTPEPERQPIAGETNAYQQPIAYATDNSHLSSNSADYSAASVMDGDETTCWQFSTKKIKLGEAAFVVELHTGGTVDEMWIKNGFWRITKGLDQYTRNGRPKKIAISYRYEGEEDFRDEKEYTLKDDKKRQDWQKVSLGRHENVTAVRIRVLSIYKGTKFKTDVAVSEVMFVERDISAAALMYETLDQSSKGKEVTALKKRLQELGYIKKGSKITNAYTDTCADRVMQFQEVNGLPQTGIADPETLALLYSEAALPKPD